MLLYNCFLFRNVFRQTKTKLRTYKNHLDSKASSYTYQTMICNFIEVIVNFDWSYADDRWTQLNVELSDLLPIILVLPWFYVQVITIRYLFFLVHPHRFCSQRLNWCHPLQLHPPPSIHYFKSFNRLNWGSWIKGIFQFLILFRVNNIEVLLIFFHRISLMLVHIVDLDLRLLLGLRY